MKIFLIFIFSFNILANVSAFGKGGKITAEQIKNLSVTRIQALRSSYVKFLRKAEADQKLRFDPKYKTMESTSSNRFQKYFNLIQKQYSAYAADGDVCFFGGWPSKEFGQFCQGPWKNKSDSMVKSFGNTYDVSKIGCGPNQFRCNPILFGAPADDPKGLCVQTGGRYGGLTQSCEENSGDNIEALVRAIKMDPNKRNELEKFSEAIFGTDPDKDGTFEGGFCNRFEVETGKKYDGCEHLKKRVSALLDPASDGQVAPKNLPVQAPPDPSFASANQALNDCNKYLEKRSDDDENGRKLLQTLQGGIANCVPRDIISKESEVALTAKDIKRVTANFDSIAYLKKLSVKDFEYKLQGLINNSFVFEDALGSDVLPIRNKEKLKNLIKEKFPQLGTDKEYKIAFDKIYNKAKADIADGKLQKIDINEAKDGLEKYAGDKDFSNLFKDKSEKRNVNKPREPVEGVNGVCRKIHNDFKIKFGEQGWFSGDLWENDDEKKEIKKYRKTLHSAVNESFYSTKVGFLLGTKTFQDRVMDTSVDLARECISDPNFKVIQASQYKEDYVTALKESQSTILDSFSDLKKKEAVIADADKNTREGDYDALSFTSSRAESAIQDLLKKDKHLLMDSLVGAENGEREDMAIFLCGQISKVYAQDEVMKSVAWVGVGASLIGGVTCMIPLTAPVGCLVAGAGTALGAVAGGARGYEGFTQTEIASKNQLARNQSAGTYNDVHQQANDQFKDGATEAALSFTGPALKLVQKGKQGASAWLESRKAAKMTSSSTEIGPANKILEGEFIGKGERGDWIPGQKGKPIWEYSDPNASVPRLGHNNGTDLVSIKPNHVAAKSSDIIDLYDVDNLGLLVKPGKAAPKLGPGDEIIEYTNSLGKVVRRVITKEARANGKLTNRHRKMAIKKAFKDRLDPDPIKLNAQVRSIYMAHKKVPCEVGKCSPGQLKQKLQMMKKAGIPDDVARESIRKGFTGFDSAAVEAQAKANAEIFGNVKPGNFRTTHKLDIPSSNPNAAWAKSIHESGGNGELVIIKVNKKMPDGSIKSQEFVGPYQGNDGTNIVIDGAGGKIVINPNDPTINISSVKISKGKITNNGDGGGVYSEHDLPVYHGNASEALNSLKGKHVNITYKIDGNEFSSKVEVLGREGDDILYRYKSSTSGELLESRMPASDIIGASRTFKKANWKPTIKRSRAETEVLEDNFIPDSPVSITVPKIDRYGRFTDETEILDGRYAGWVESNGVKEIAIRQPDGGLKYYNFDVVEDLRSQGGVIEDFTLPVGK